MDIIIEWLLENVFFWTAVLGFCLGFILKNSKYSKCENALRLMFFWYVGYKESLAYPARTLPTTMFLGHIIF